MLAAMGLLDQVKAWQDVFGGGPLAAFLGLLVIALVAVFGLYVRSNGKLFAEQKSHSETLKTTAALTVAIERTWAEHLRVQSEQLRKAEEAHDLQRQTIDALEKSVSLHEWAQLKLEKERSA